MFSLKVSDRVELLCSKSGSEAKRRVNVGVIVGAGRSGSGSEVESGVRVGVKLRAE